MNTWTGLYRQELHATRANGGVGLAVNDEGVLLSADQVAEVIDVLIDMYDEIRAEERERDGQE